MSREHRLRVGEGGFAQGCHVEVDDEVDKEDVSHDHVDGIEDADPSRGADDRVKIHDVAEHYPRYDDERHRDDHDEGIGEFLQGIEPGFR